MSSENVSEVWASDRLWAPIYSFLLDRPPLTRLMAGIAFRTDMRHLYEAIARISNAPDGSAILDVPCGGGVALRGLRRNQDVRYVAADISEDMLARTRAEAQSHGLTQVETLYADITAMPFEDGAFDLTLSFTGLHCVPDPHAAVLELGRVTRSGGTISGSLWLSDVATWQLPLRTAARTSGRIGRSASQRQMETWLPEAGFATPQILRSGDFLYFEAEKL